MSHNQKNAAFRVMMGGLAALLWALPVAGLEVTGDTKACHDPSRIIEENGQFYILSTAPNINVRASSDLINWSWQNRVFDYGSGQPPWMDFIATGGDLWAPDVIQRPDDSYFIYYSRNLYPDTGGERTVCGVATASSISGPTSDAGAVLNLDLYDPGYRAIDPAPIYDSNGDLWLAVGSFGAPNGDGASWGGIRLFAMDETSGKRESNNDSGTRIAGWLIEAPYLYYHGGYYYLFFNEGRCCEGLDSTYYIRVGRAMTITGPYTDMSGGDLNPANSGGSLFMGLDFPSNYTGDTTNATPRTVMGDVGAELGPGHAGISKLSDGVERFTYHYYDITNDGEPTLGLRSIVWGVDGWPRPGWRLTDGVYAIGTRYNVDGASEALWLADNNGTLILSPYQGAADHQWQLSRTNVNSYRVENVASGETLAFSGNAALLESANMAAAGQNWLLEQTNDMSFRIESERFRAGLHAEGDTRNSGVSVQDNINLSSAQRWFITPVGAHRICVEHGGMCATGGTAGSNVTMTPSADDTAQYWWSVPTPSGYVKLVNVASGLAMTLQGIDLTMAAVADSDNQRFSLDILPAASIRIVPKLNGQALEVANGATAAGALLRSGTWVHTRNQQFSLTYIDSITVDGPGNEDPPLEDTDTSDDSVDPEVRSTDPADSDGTDADSSLEDTDPTLGANQNDDNDKNNDISTGDNDSCGCRTTPSASSLLRLLL